MDPASMGMAASAGGGVIKAIGSLISGDAESKMYKYKAGMAAMNAKIAMQNADYERKVGEVQAQQVGLRSGEEIAKTKAIQGASGLDVNRGSAVDVRSSELQIGQENEAVVRGNSAHRAYGQEVKAMEATAEGQLDSASASFAKTASYINAAGSILGASSSVSDKWMQGNSVGAFGGGGGDAGGGGVFNDTGVPGDFSFRY